MPAVRIPRTISGAQLIAILLALLVTFGTMLGLYGPLPGVIAMSAAAASLFFLRPSYLLDADGLHFEHRILWLVPIRNGSIDRSRIRSIRVGWDKENYVQTCRSAAVIIPRKYLSVALQYVRRARGRKTTFTLYRPRTMEEAWEKAREYGRALGCPVKKR
jgi:hypothetical protein